MGRIVVLACVAALGLLASPVGAQQSPDASAPLPEAQQLPPPPPFPPMPSARPSHRWVDMGDHRTRRSSKPAAKAHAAAKSSKPQRASKAHHGASAKRHEKAHASKRPAPRAAKPMHFSKKTIRTCHAMTYRQIMRDSRCRTMMKQELASPQHSDRAARHKAKKHKTDNQKSASHKSPKKAAQHHSAKRHKR